MPRRLRDCSQCKERFIALTRKDFHCADCSKTKSIESSSHFGAAESSTIEVEPSNQSTESSPETKHLAQEESFHPEEHLQQQHPIDDNVANNNEHDNDDDEAHSEGGDDLNCTQLIDLASDSSSEEQEIPNMADSAQDLLLIANEKKSETVSNSCFICGCSLEHIKTGARGRINHIKRCSKKHGIAARDIRLNDDQEVFDMNQSASSPPSCSLEHNNGTVVNPYAKSTKFASKNSVSAPKVVVEDGIEKRSAFGLLLAGAKRVAKTEQIVSTANQNKHGKRQRWGNGSNYTRSGCPSYKKISGTDFVCDGFHYAKHSLTNNYFLTHFHSDHWGGITKAWNCGTIYCSQVTATLVKQQLGVDPRYLHPLPMHTATVIGSLGKPVTVTLLDANHCPGAVMFLFEVGGRSILHVGDFRWNREVMKAQSSLQPFFRGTRLSEIYLDTTYCNPKYDLPSQADAIKATIKVATDHVTRCQKADERLLLLFGAYTIGKEKIFMSVAQSLGMKVYVDSKRYRVLSSLEWSAEKMDLLTKNPLESTLWVVPLGHVNMDQLSNYLTAKARGSTMSFDRIVGFRPTGWSLSSKRADLIGSSTRGKLTVCSVPYSEHSSFPELLDCLACLSPRKITPTVSVRKSEEQVNLLQQHFHLKQTKLDF